MSAEQSICRRCGKPFTPRPLTSLPGKPLTNCCQDCGLRNVLDSLDLPTPPELLDPHSLHPTLSDREFQQELRKPEPPED